ncbi:MAG: RDD family protein [Terriglobales bacterium]
MSSLTNSAREADTAPQPHELPVEIAGEAGVEAPAETSAPQMEFDPWRSEVAARLARYRARRKPRAPRYPSLLLPFDSPGYWSKPAAEGDAGAVSAVSAESEFSAGQTEAGSRETGDAAITADLERSIQAPEAEAGRFAPAENRDEVKFEAKAAEAKILEFPRSAAIPSWHPSLLADPIFDRPRIVEAPEMVPPPPALGGILIEPVPERPAENPVEARIESASILRRLGATAVDGAIVTAALAAFGAIFWRLNPTRGPWSLLAAMGAGAGVLLWLAYQYLFVVYTGSTLGLRAARLKLVRFDGSPVNRRLRRWRVVASFLSAFSAGLGYLWCVLDADSLCWHDRITKTCLQISR